METQCEIAVVGTTWGAHVIEEALANAGYEPRRSHATEIPETSAAVIVVGDRLDGIPAANDRGHACVAVRVRPVTEHDAVAAVCAGADAVVCGADGIEAVLAAVRSVVRGEAACSPRVAQRAIETLRREVKRGKPRVELTPRQYAVLERIVHGESVKQTARTLGIAEKTVENTQSRLYRRLGVRTRAQAVAVALAEGLIDTERVGAIATR